MAAASAEVSLDKADRRVPVLRARLAALEELGATSENMINWQKSLTDKTRLTPETTPWLYDEDLYQFFRDEGKIDADKRLSNAAGYGLW